MTLTPEFALLVAVVVLAAVNLGNNQLAPAAYLPTCLVTTALLLGLYASTSLPWSQAGLGADALWPGIGWGLALIAVVAVAYLVALRLPMTRAYFYDRRAAARTKGVVAYQVLLRIPLGTVLLEEVAFRGVLFALLTAIVGVGWATAISAALFGLWHVLPSRDIRASNPAAGRALGGQQARIIAGAVLSTAVAGVALIAIARFTASLAPVMALHWATNGLGYVMAFLVSRAWKDDVVTRTPSLTRGGRS